MSFIEWFLSNWYANCFTIIIVVLSGRISLIKSAVYYRKGNRNNLKMAVIYPSNNKIIARCLFKKEL